MVKKKYVIGLLLLWAGALLSFIAYKQYTMQTGTVVLLKTVPVDPRDLFRGDYVILRYDISRIHMDSIEIEGGPFEKNDKIYLKLESNSKYAQAVQLSKYKFTNDLFISGTVTRTDSLTLNIKYGIESYFVKQGTGKDIERLVGDIDVVVAIDKNGNTLIKELLYEGENIHEHSSE